MSISRETPSVHALGGADVAMERAGLKTVSELKLAPIWVNPGHTVATARYVMAGHKVRAIGVMESDRLVGTLSYEHMAGQPDDTPVSEAMLPVAATVEGDATIRAVAQQLFQDDADFVAAISGGKFLGIVTATMLLKELSRTWDPLTGLSWSDQLRDWGMEQLRAGVEVTIIFIDLDDFGQYNKRYGHIVGDRVLQRVAKYLKDCTDETADVLVRYGGDEFAIGTTRTRKDAEQLVDVIEHRIAGTFIGEAEQPVSISVGVFGGRRTHERENVHIAATLDSLINLASRACMAQKQAKRGGPDPTVTQPVQAAQTVQEPAQAPSAAAGPKVVEVYADEKADRGVTMVTLDIDGSVHRGVYARTAGSSVLESVVLATFNALERMSPGLALRMSDVQVTGAGSAVSAVDVRGWKVSAGKEQPIAGSSTVRDDLLLAAAHAALAAVGATRP